MSNRITRTMLENKFRQYCATFGLPTTEPGQYPTHGQYFIESHPAGYVIARLCDTTSGTSNPLGDRLWSPSELFHVLYFAIATHQAAPSPVVTVSLNGGLLEVTYKPAGVQVNIHDYDAAENPEDEDVIREDSAGRYVHWENAPAAVIHCGEIQ